MIAMSLLLIRFKLYFNLVTFVLAIIININANNQKKNYVRRNQFKLQLSRREDRNGAHV